MHMYNYALKSWQEINCISVDSCHFDYEAEGKLQNVEMFFVLPRRINREEAIA
jgi:hypothetical protein